MLFPREVLPGRALEAASAARTPCCGEFCGDVFLLCGLTVVVARGVKYTLKDCQRPVGMTVGREPHGVLVAALSTGRFAEP